MNLQEDTCMICCSETKLIQNICGDSFCEDCWFGHIKQHADSLNPFMNCMGC